MVEARADVTIPVSPQEAFAAATNLEKADWLPAVRGVKHVGGPRTGLGARYDVEVGMGRHLQGVLVYREFTAPTRAVLVLEEGLDLTITVTITEVSGGCTMELVARYSVGGAFGGAVERASIGAARREVARGVEQFAAQFGRKAARPAAPKSRTRRAS